MRVDPSGENKDELRPFGSGARFYVQQHVILYVSVSEGEREREKLRGQDSGEVTAAQGR